MISIVKTSNTTHASYMLIVRTALYHSKMLRVWLILLISIEVNLYWVRAGNALTFHSSVFHNCKLFDKIPHVMTTMKISSIASTPNYCALLCYGENNKCGKFDFDKDYNECRLYSYPSVQSIESNVMVSYTIQRPTCSTVSGLLRRVLFTRKYTTDNLW